MKRVLLGVLGMSVLLAFWQAFAADTITGAVYEDTNGDGQVETITVTFDENITCTSGPGSNGWSVNTAGSINVSAITNVACSGTADVVLTVTADADETGGATDPTLDYTDASGDLAGAGQISDKSNQAATDSADPVLLSFTSTALDDEYGPTSGINITATASEDVTAASSLTVDVNTGATGIALSCAGSSPTCTGTYTVGATGSGENTTDLAVSNISAASLVDGDGNTNTGTTLPGTNISDGSDIEVDTTAPTLTFVHLESNGSNTAYAKTGDTVTIQIVADEEIGTPTVMIDGNAADTVTNPSGNDWNATRVMQAGDTEWVITFSIAFSDTAATSTNAGTTVTAVTGGGTDVTYDETVPVVAITDDILAGPVQSDDFIATNTETNPDTFEYGFSADTTCDAGDTYGNALTSGVAVTFNTETNNGNYICVESTDLAGNIGYSVASANDLNIDITSPTATITTSVDPIFEGALTQTVTVTYDESMNNGTSPTIVITGSTNFSSNSDGAWSTTTNTDDTYTETFTHNATEEEVASVTAGTSVAGATDLAGNNENVPATSAGFEVDTDEPEMVSAVTDDLDGNGQIDTIVVTFSEDLNGASVTGADFSVAGYTVASASETSAWVATITLTESGSDDTEATPTVSISGAGSILDLAGNALNTADDGDSVAPTDGADPVLKSFTSTTTDGTYGPASGINVTASYSENVTGSITVSLNNTVTGLVLTCAGGSDDCTGTYIVGATGSGEDVTDLTVSAITAESASDGTNTQTGSSLPSGANIADTSDINVDVTAPALQSFTSTTADGTYGPGSNINITATYDENVTGSLSVDLNNTVTGVSLTCGGTTECSGTYTVGATGSGEDTSDLTVSSIASESVTDSYSNTQSSSSLPGTNVATGSDIVIDVDAPTLVSFTSTTADGTYGPTTGINVTATYNENVTGSLTVSLNNTVTGLVLSCGGTTECSGTYTVGASGSGEDVTTLDVSAITSESATDGASNTQSSSTLPATTIATASSINVDVTLPVLQSFTSSTADNTYGPTSAINVTATYDENVTGSLTVSLNNTVTGVSLTCSGTTTCTGTYTVGATGSGEDVTDLTVSAITAESAVDDYGNDQTGSAVPGTNIATGSDINVDTTAPTLPTVSIASSYATGLAIQSADVTLSFTSDEAVVSTPTVVLKASDGDDLWDCGATTDTSTGARTGWEEVCDIKVTDAEGVITFTIDFVDDYGNVGTQVTSTTDSTSVTIDIAGDSGGGGTGGGSDSGSSSSDDSTTGDDEDEEEDEEEEELIDNEDEEEDEDMEDENNDEDENGSDDDEDENEEFLERKDTKSFMSFHDHLSAAGVVKPAKDCEDANCDKNALRKEVAGVAVNLGGHKLVPSSSYSRQFTDVDYDADDWVPAVVETGLAIGFISGANTVFRPEETITRAEVYGMLMMSVCLPVPQVDADWKTNVFYQAAAKELTVRSEASFEPNTNITRKELFVIASRLLEYRQKTGGCY